MPGVALLSCARFMYSCPVLLTCLVPKIPRLCLSSASRKPEVKNSDSIQDEQSFLFRRPIGPLAGFLPLPVTARSLWLPNFVLVDT
ncbi:hypothetical protein Cob_v009600 [Colletotrichum orbiculare MAFF 240422]|uniref:Secreted protein n=1 Tax=Colletotrichum orbiculare (strain 104-T / ATCC 96160 / CBS 514.97 / LARS 414 / MAFF 240422) TaxID=1213857 RepID=A0A484FHY2_COLOR|nr:hypothetical protein Cob_v009600 [Colletotrichum orbiculare MAFF 240422]